MIHFIIIKFLICLQKKQKNYETNCDSIQAFKVNKVLFLIIFQHFCGRLQFFGFVCHNLITTRVPTKRTCGVNLYFINYNNYYNPKQRKTEIKSYVTQKKLVCFNLYQKSCKKKHCRRMQITAVDVRDATCDVW